MGGSAFDQPAEVVLASSDAPGSGQVPLAGSPGSFRGQRSGCGDFAALHFDSLPGTLREVQEIAQLWSKREKRFSSRSKDRAPRGSEPVLKLTGAQADERAFNRNASRHAVLHLATHGFFITGLCPSALDQGGRGKGALAGRQDPRTAAPAGENPLVLSGLALAGANHRKQARPEEEDRILRAEEIAGVDMSGVQWAVLSACETGVGSVRAGEGVFGVRRAFQVAGARTVLMSLWAVDDESTRRWMRALYVARLMRKMGTAEAVRAACIVLLREQRARGLGTHPFYLGAFVAAGDWR